MSHNIFIFVITALLTLKHLYARLENNFKPDSYSKLSDATITILKSCFLGDIRTFALIGNSNDILNKEREFSESISTILIGNSRSNCSQMFSVFPCGKSHYDYLCFFNIGHILHVFVVTGSSQSLLKLMLQKLKESMWWNSKGFFIILDDNNAKHGCKNARSFLWIAWNMDLLSSIFLCYDDHGLIIYTYNPYTNQAPTSWKEAGTFAGIEGHPWTLFKQKFIKGQTYCKDMSFDKTNTLGGYKIKIDAIELKPTLYFDSNQTKMNKYKGEDGLMVRILWSKLNATIHLKQHKSDPQLLGYMDANGTIYGMFGDVSNGKYDTSMNSRYLMVKKKIWMTYPHSVSGFCFLSKHRGYMTQLDKLIIFFQPKLSLSLLFVLLGTFIVLAFFVGQGLIPAFLNILRMIFMTSLIQLPYSNSARIFIYTVFILFLVINTLFAGHLASLLTVPVPNSNLNTIQDLKDLGYILYGFTPFKRNFDDPVLQNRYRDMEDSYCVDNLNHNMSIACLGDCLHLMNWNKNAKPHTSKRIFTLYLVYVTRENWPLHGKVNVMIQRIKEAGLIDFWRDNTVATLQRVESPKISLPTSKVLRLKDLSFSFNIWAIGVACAIIVFIIELMVL